jgi:hypothetical protein
MFFVYLGILQPDIGRYLHILEFAVVSTIVAYNLTYIIVILYSYTADFDFPLNGHSFLLLL